MWRDLVGWSWSVPSLSFSFLAVVFIMFMNEFQGGEYLEVGNASAGYAYSVFLWWGESSTQYGAWEGREVVLVTYQLQFWFGVFWCPSRM